MNDWAARPLDERRSFRCLKPPEPACWCQSSSGFESHVVEWAARQPRLTLHASRVVESRGGRGPLPIVDHVSASGPPQPSVAAGFSAACPAWIRATTS